MARQGTPIPFTTRETVRKLVFENGLSRRRAALLLDIDNTTANKYARKLPPVRRVGTL